MTVLEHPLRRSEEDDDVLNWPDFFASNVGKEWETTERFTSDRLTRTNLRSAPTIEKEERLKRASNRLLEPNGRRRTTSLLVLLAHLGGTSFEEAAQLIGTSTPQLTRYVQAEVSLPRTMFERVMQIDEVLRHLHKVLEPRATRDWLSTAIPALGDRTPFHLISHRRIEPLLNHVKKYSLPVEYT